MPYDHNPERCPHWAAVFLAAECRRYGELAGFHEAGGSCVETFRFCKGELRAVLQSWLGVRREQQDSILGTVTVSLTDDEALVPHTYEDVCLAVFNNKLTVSTNHCDTAPWGHSLNVFLRAVHDIDHALQEFDMSVEHEIRLGLLHASMAYQWARAQGYAAKLCGLLGMVLAIDTAGQAFYFAVDKEYGGPGFVPDQTEYLEYCLTHGVLKGTRMYQREVARRD